MKHECRKSIRSLVAVAMCVITLAACGASTDSIAETENSTPPNSSSEKKPVYQSPIDFYELVSKNVDICGWLTVGGTNIDYPVTRTTDNKYYLTHDSFRNEFAGGGLFIDMSNAPDFSSPVTVVYGHVMPDDTIFSQLLLYSDADFFKSNKNITIYLPDNMLTYEIFAAFPNGTENVLYQKDYSDESQLQALLEYIESKRKEDGTNLAMETVTAQDKIIMLSTCSDEGASRYLVAARLATAAVE